MGRGLINETFRVAAGSTGYVLQRLNGDVFPHPERIMANLRALCDHAARNPDSGVRIPLLMRTRDGEDFLRDLDSEAGGAESIWRLTELIPDALDLPRVETPRQARETGGVLGRFHRLVATLPPERLAVTLPGFHHTPSYLGGLEAALQAAGPGSQTDEARDCIAVATRHAALARVLEAAREQGRIALRVTHGDPKIDNILFARADGRALALIDLDTVQPGLIQHDIGDCLRSGCNRGGESQNGDDSVRFDLEICRGILAGYADATRGLLDDEDIALLYDAVRLLPFELGVRFLTDHLEGDRYFRVRAHGENLRKARVQFALVADIERNEGAIRAIIADCFGRGSGTV